MGYFFDTGPLGGLKSVPTVEALDEAVDGEKAKIMTGAELIKEKSKVFSYVIREFEQTAVDLEANTMVAKQKVSQTAEQMINKIREREREAFTAIENSRVSRNEKLNAAKAQVQSFIKQMNQAVEFASNLVQRSSSSDIMQSKEKRFEDLNNIPAPVRPVSSFVKFVSTAEPENLTLGVTAIGEPIVEGLTQDFQAGVETEFVICPKLIEEGQGTLLAELLVEPAEQAGSVTTFEREDGNFLVKFTPKLPGMYNIKVTINGENLHQSPFIVQVKERRLEIVGELDLKGETLQSPRGIAVNSEGLIAVTDRSGHCILTFDKEGKFLRKFGRKGQTAGKFKSPSGVTYLNDDHILVADEGNHRIQQFNVHTGNFVKAFGKRGTGEGELLEPEGVCVDDEGRVAVADLSNNRIQVFTEDGEPVLRFGILNRPNGCIFLQKMFIVCDSWSHCLKIFDRSGEFLRNIGEQGEGDGQLRLPLGLCVEKCGDHHYIFVCDRNNQRIVQFSVEGSFIGKTFTELRDPTGITITPDGRILVTGNEAKTIYILK